MYSVRHILFPLYSKNFENRMSEYSFINISNFSIKSILLFCQKLQLSIEFLPNMRLPTYNSVQYWRKHLSTFLGYV